LAFAPPHPAGDPLSFYDRDNGIRYKPCDTCANPDIYFLLFDEYASSRALWQSLGYDKRGVDSFLLQRGFHIQYDSRSNYHYTPFSMASILNMSYLRGIKQNALDVN